MRTGILEDVYLTIVSSPNEQGRVTVGVAVNPMTLWIWIGGGLMALGTIVAIGPTVRRRIRVRAGAPGAGRADRAGRARTPTRPSSEEVGV